MLCSPVDRVDDIYICFAELSRGLSERTRGEGPGTNKSAKAEPESFSCSKIKREVKQVAKSITRVSVCGCADLCAQMSTSWEGKLKERHSRDALPGTGLRWAMTRANQTPGSTSQGSEPRNETRYQPHNQCSGTDVQDARGGIYNAALRCSEESGKSPPSQGH